MCSQVCEHYGCGFDLRSSFTNQHMWIVFKTTQWLLKVSRTFQPSLECIRRVQWASTELLFSVAQALHNSCYQLASPADIFQT